MSLLRTLARGYIVNRLLRGSRHRGYGRGTMFRPPRGSGSWYGSRYGAYGRGHRSRGRGGFIGPFPHYSTRTRRGARVHVGGCCLPIPLMFVAAAATAVHVVRRR